MADIQSFGLFLAFWAGLYLLDIVLRSNARSQSWYCRFMDGNGLSISVGQVRWYTMRFNRLFLRLGQFSPWIAKAWFSVGAVFGLIAQLASVYLLSYMVYQTVMPARVDEGDATKQEKVLTPVMPGVNLPTNQLGYYLMTLLVCGILHEAGHAIAAVREQVKVNGFGVLFVAVYPGAFVDLNSEQMHAISPFRQLRIYCAGIWHNFIIVLVALATLVSLPYLLLPLYRTGGGALVTHVVEDSPVYGPRGLQPGDLITRVDTCYVTGTSTWHLCVHRMYARSQVGYCVAREQIRMHDSSSKHQYSKLGDQTECCDRQTNTHVCFKCLGRTGLMKNFACLPARHVTRSRAHCTHASHCPLAQACVLPSLDNSTRLVRVQHESKEPLLYLGHSVDLLYSVQTSDYDPRFPLLPLYLPYVLQTFCRYLVSLSGALVLLNVVPCYALDGQWILHAFVEIALARVACRDTRLHVFSAVLAYGTLILVCNIAIALWTLFR